jgi:hypothetical protein
MSTLIWYRAGNDIHLDELVTKKRTILPTNPNVDNCPESCLMSILVWCRPWSDIKLEMILTMSILIWCRPWSDIELEMISILKLYQAWKDVSKRAVTHKCQNIFLRRLSTYKCQNESTGNQEMNNITYKSQSRQLSWMLFDIEFGMISSLVWFESWNDIELEIISILKWYQAGNDFDL